MSAENFDDLRHHVGHELACVMYGDAANVAVECETCGTVLLDFDAPNALTPEAAAERLRAGGGSVLMVVGTGADDPKLILTLEDGGIMSESIAGWSQGVREPVCSANSDFLDRYLCNRERLEVIP